MVLSPIAVIKVRIIRCLPLVSVVDFNTAIVLLIADETLAQSNFSGCEVHCKNASFHYLWHRSIRPPKVRCSGWEEEAEEQTASAALILFWRALFSAGLSSIWSVKPILYQSHVTAARSSLMFLRWNEPVFVHLPCFCPWGEAFVFFVREFGSAFSFVPFFSRPTAVSLNASLLVRFRMIFPIKIFIIWQSEKNENNIWHLYVPFYYLIVA